MGGQGSVKEVESLQQQKQRAIAEEAYQQAAEIKKRAEALTQQLQSLMSLRAESQQHVKRQEFLNKV